MKNYAALIIAIGVFLAGVIPAHAQFGDLLKKAQEAIEQVAPKEREADEQVAPKEREAEAESERQRLAANQELLSTVDANSDCAALFPNDSSFNDQCWSLRRAANLEQYEVAQKMEDEARQQRRDDHIASLTVIGQDEVVELLKSGLPGKLQESNEIGWEILFIAQLKGMRSDADYKFKGDMTCSDDWGDKVGNRTEVTGTVVFDTSGVIDFSFTMNEEMKAGTWVIVTLNQLDLGVKSTDMTKVDSCTFSGLRIKSA